MTDFKAKSRVIYKEGKAITMWYVNHPNGGKNGKFFAVGTSKEEALSNAQDKWDHIQGLTTPGLGTSYCEED